MLRELGIVIIVVSIIFQSIAGLMDIYKKEEICISKEHIFADSIYLLILGIGVFFYDHVKSRK